MSVEQMRDLAAQGKWTDIASQFRLVSDEELGPEGAFLKGLAGLCSDDPAMAVAAGGYALAQLDTVREPADLVALAYALVGDVANASYYRKLAVTRTSDPALAALWPADVLPGFETAFLAVSERPLFHRGMSCFAQGDYRGAEHAFTQQAFFTPRDRDTLLGLAVSFLGQNLWESAVPVLQGLRHLYPQDPLVAGELAGALARSGRYVESQALYREAQKLAPPSPGLRITALLDALRNLSIPEEKLRRQFASFGPSFAKPGKAVRLNVAPEGSPLNVLCIVGSSGRSRASLVITEILTHIDPRQFRLVGMGFKELSHPANQVYQAPFDDWVDISDVDANTFRAIVRAQTPHIIIDFTGIESPDLLPAFATRMAAVQVSWQNQPFDLGLAGYTHVISDPWTVSGGGNGDVPVLSMASGAALIGQESDLTEQTNRSEQVEVGVVADFADLHPDMIGAWAEILRACPTVTLLMHDHNFRNTNNQKHLIDLFGLYGLSHRVDVVSDVDLRGFLRQIDVLLVAGRVSQPSVALDALRQGVLPVLLSSSNRVGRQAFALLDQVGLLEHSVGADLDDYAEKAIRLISDPTALRALQTSAVQALGQAPLLNGKGRAAELSALLLQAYQQAVKEIEG